MADIEKLVSTLEDFVRTLRETPTVKQKPSPKDILLTQNIAFDPFDESAETFDSYAQRLQNFLKLKGLDGEDCETEEAKVLVLINCLGSRQYQLLSSLTAPDLPSTKSFTELLSLLKKHLAPKPNTLTEQHKFFSRIQRPGESISTFISNLKDLTKNAEFKSKCNDTECTKFMLNLLLRSQFIRGLSDSDIREKLLQQGDIDFDKTIEIALAIEAAKIENKEVYKSNSSNYVNKISNKNTKSLQNNKKNNSSWNSRPMNKNYENKSKSKMSNKRPPVNLKELGLEGLCLHCGKSNHKTNECFIVKKLHCKLCNRKGHVPKVCISNTFKQKFENRNVQQITDNPTDFNVNRVYDVFINDGNFDDKMYAIVKLNGIDFKFECDSGSKVSLMDLIDFKKLNLNVPLQKTEVSFRSYTGQIFKPIGVAKLNVSYDNNISTEDLYIVQMNKNALLGRDWIRHLKINLNELNQISSVLPDISISKILDSYSDVFQNRVGHVPNYVCSLKLKPEAKPIFLKPRPVPYALKTEVDKELDKLEADGIIEKIDHSEWGTPLVIVPKSDGSVRICADYKVTVNKQLLDARHPIPRIEDIFNKLRGGSYFCTLDIHKAYLHILVDDESSKIQTISTHRGTYLAKRLFFGIKTAPSEFHKFIDQFTQDLEGVIAYFDDLIIQGKTREECKNRLLKVLDKLRENNLHVNYSKCKFFERKVQYLGHIISAEGLQKSPDKIKAIINAPRPKNVTELKQFLGLVMYYSKFIENASEILYPLNQLLRKNVPFKWNDNCEKAFISAKSEIASEKVLIPYNSELPVTLATDASPFGFSGVLSHIMPDGTERPIAFASRSLTNAEKSYSQLDKEATAVYWSFKKFFDYIYGRKFTLIVDNKPLMTIFHPEKKLPVLSATRMLRYAHYISNFDFIIQYRKSSDHLNADYLSRNPLSLNSQEVNFADCEYFFQESVINNISTETVTAKIIEKETEKDSELSKLKEDILHGKNFDPAFTLHNGILFRGQRVMIPKTLQSRLLEDLHSTHIGIVKMKALARNYCYWKNIDSDIEHLVKSCKECCDVKKNPSKAPIHAWEAPDRNWQRIHIDYAGPFLNHFFLLVIDAKSKWPEIFAMKQAPTSFITIKYLQEIFSRLGLPEFLVSDNASIFKSFEFQQYCKENGIQQRLIAPGHPSTNGQAERYVQTLKAKLKCMKFYPGTLHDKLCEFLMKFRATPLSSGKTPAELLFGKNIRTKLDLIKPASILKRPEQYPNFNKSFKLGERVQSRNYTVGQKWKYGIVVEKLGKLHYLIELDDGYVIKRHFDQLRSCEVDFNFSPEASSNYFQDSTSSRPISISLYQPKVPNISSPEVSPQYQPNTPEVKSPSKTPKNSFLDVTRPSPVAQSSSPQRGNQRFSTTTKPVQYPNLPDSPKSQPLRRSSRVKKPVIRLNL